MLRLHPHNVLCRLTHSTTCSFQASSSAGLNAYHSASCLAFLARRLCPFTCSPVHIQPVHIRLYSSRAPSSLLPCSSSLNVTEAKVPNRVAPRISSLDAVIGHLEAQVRVLPKGIEGMHRTNNAPSISITLRQKRN